MTAAVCWPSSSWQLGFVSQVSSFEVMRRVVTCKEGLLLAGASFVDEGVVEGFWVLCAFVS